MDNVGFVFALSLGLFLGIIIGAVFMAAATWWMLREQKRGKSPLKSIARSSLIALMVALLSFTMMFGRQVVQIAYAQTATIVPLDIPINPVFEQTNNWMATFAPIVAIGIGITLALAIFGFIARMIKSAF